MGKSSLVGIAGLPQDLNEILNRLGIVLLRPTDQAVAHQDVGAMSVVGKHQEPL